MAETEARKELQRRMKLVEESALARRALHLEQEMRQREAVLARALMDSRREGAAMGAALAERDAAVAELTEVQKALAESQASVQHFKTELDQIHSSRLWRFTRFLCRKEHS
ncbi:hypothetical protein FCK22_16360 [Sulfitobacter sp. 15WGC]|nr:hypothetical protein FCK22_16360 [Sulfitobacter sp. 15WGC]